MPRGKAAARKPTVEELTDAQREIWDALPDQLRARFLDQLPEVKPSAAAQKQAERLERYLGVLRRIQAVATRRIEELTPLVKQAQLGRELPNSVFDLPKIDGAQIKITGLRQRAAGGAGQSGTSATDGRSRRAAERVTVTLHGREWSFPTKPTGEPYKVGRVRDEEREARERAFTQVHEEWEQTQVPAEQVATPSRRRGG